MAPFLINRRNLIAASGGTLLAGNLPGAETGGGRKNSRPPNFLVIIADDLRWDSIGAMGNRIAATSAIDKLADRGTLFKNCFVTTSICPTSRASILTGQYGRRHGIWAFNISLSGPQMAETYPVLLRGAGYKTCFVGKWGVGNTVPVSQFDNWYGFAGQGQYFDPKNAGQHLGDVMEAQARSFIDSYAGDAPFCLIYCSKEVHEQREYDTEPYKPKLELRELFANITFPRPATATAESFNRLPDFLKDSEGRKRWIPRFSSDELFQSTMRAYYQLLSGLDRSIAAILRSLENRNLLDNTYVIFTSDNGNMLGDHGLAAKWWMFEESIRVPLIIAPPRSFDAAAGRVTSDIALNIDIAPTVLELAGVPIPSRMQGRSLVPTLERRAGGDWRTEFFYEHLIENPAIIKSVGLRSPRFKYVRYFGIEMVFESLFDLDADPFEETDLARIAALEARKSEMSAKVDALMKTLA